MIGSLFNFLFELEQHKNKRQYSKTKIKDLDLEFKKEMKKIEEDPEKLILNVLHKNGERIIVYRTIFRPGRKIRTIFYRAESYS
ncbi:MAG: hypothetical protein AB2392_22005 [Neobacillus sp.]